MLKKLSVEELMDLEVTSVSRRPEKLSNVASAVQVVTADDIRRAGVTRLPEALRLAGNLEVAQINSHDWAITARGFNNSVTNKLLVLIDGRTVYTPLYAGVFWDAQDVLLEDLDRIEVISGPGATQWGANAVNGVINITTKSAKDTQGGLLYGALGGEWRGGAGARYGGQAGRDTYYRVYVKHSVYDDSEFANGTAAADDWEFTQGGFRVDHNAGNGATLTVQGDAYRGREQQATQADVKLNGANVLTRWSSNVNDESSWRAQIYYDRTHRDIPGSIAQTLNTYDADVQQHLARGNHDIVWGLNYRLVDDSIRNPPTLAFLPADVTRQWFGTFAQDQVVFLPDQLHLLGGVKLEHNPYTGWELQPSVRLVWQPAPRHTVWSAVSRAVRTPSRIDREFFAPRDPPFTSLQGGPNFASEKLLAYELGYRVQPRSDLAIALSLFYHDYNDLRSLEPVNPPANLPAVLANGLKGYSYGAELTADWRVMEAWHLRASYNELRVHSETKPGSLDRSSTRSVSLDPRHQFLLRSSFDLPSSTEFDVTLRSVGPIEGQAVPGYTELDVRLGWRLAPAWEFSLVGQNLLHNRHAEFGAVATRREVARTFYGKATWKF